MGYRGMEEPGAGVRVVCGAVGACLAGRIVANVETSRSPREDYPRCSVGWCAGVQASPESVGGGRETEMKERPFTRDFDTTCCPVCCWLMSRLSVS